ncbi:helix-turn-helix domain-containing protein [Allomuricauda sp. NBRC 101325]|uniref:helix-turn-helix domain-containing protein n=1 Tax=Allomuricauda sp. NBRC 101325 TaxID=1113758 RepID=UPI0024A5D913|nr:helix-turn-helix domain-containing protein [Muricauda sp. NBRC 101325]GLU43939.1 transcriptional regulator [Muricauda sp. NBRC 101325]
MSSLLNYNGLYGDQYGSVLPDFFHCEPLSVRSAVYNWEITKHLHTDLTQIFIIEKGKGLLLTSNSEIPFEGPGVIIVPAHHLHGFKFEAHVAGDVITFSENFMEQLFKNNPNILYKINRLDYHSLHSNPRVLEDILYTKNRIMEELTDVHHEKLALQPLFELFCVTLYKIARHKEDRKLEIKNKSLKYFRAYQRKIRQSTTSQKNVSEYASELGITTVHLNRICKNVVQKTALDVIHDQLIREAKKYLLNTQYSISEISYFLNFKDPAYFTRMFKRHVGVSPSDFKKG